MRERAQSFFEEPPLPIIEMAPRLLRDRTRREVLLFGAGAVVAAAGCWISSAANDARPPGRASRYELSREGVAAEQSIFVSTMTWPKHSTRKIVWCPPTPSRRLLQSRTTTTEPLLILAIFRDGV